MIFGGLKQLENAAILMVKNPANMQYLDEVLDIPEISDGTLEVAKNQDIVFDPFDRFSFFSHPIQGLASPVEQT